MYWSIRLSTRVIRRSAAPLAPRRWPRAPIRAADAGRGCPRRNAGCTPRDRASDDAVGAPPACGGRSDDKERRQVTALVLAAHGSADPRSAANARAVAGRMRRMRPGLDVRVAFCELNEPRLVDALTPDAVVNPFLLADAYHARIDIPRQIAACGVTVRQADVLGEDERLVWVLGERLAEL